MKTTEQLEMERIEMLKKELQKKKHMSVESFKKSQQSTAYVPVRSANPVTKTEEFHFASDSRIKKPQETKQTTKKDFASGLRAHSTSPVSYHSWLYHLFVM